MAVRKFRLTINGVVYEVEAEEIEDKLPSGATPPLPKPSPKPVREPEVLSAPSPASPSDLKDGVTVEAPLPGAVLDVRTGVGQTVVQGQIIVILEAMKMENEITAPISGRISVIHVQKGGTVSAQDPLFRVEP